MKKLFVLALPLLLLAACSGKGGDSQTSQSEAPTSHSEAPASHSEAPASTSEEPGPSGLTITVSVNDEQASWAFKDDIPIFAHFWYGETSDWVPVSFTPAEGTKEATFVIPEESVGFLVVRCSVGTALEEGKYPNWQTGGDEVGRIYNKTDDVTVVAGTTSYGVVFGDYAPSAN